MRIGTPSAASYSERSATCQPKASRSTGRVGRSSPRRSTAGVSRAFGQCRSQVGCRHHRMTTATATTMPDEAPFRSGFATLIGRPNVGKSTLLNAILGEKVSIVSDKAQTTRMPVRGVLTRPGAQLVFVDTPGIHNPVSALGERLNQHAKVSIGDVDVVCFVVDAGKPFGRGDLYVADRLSRDSICVINKIDAVPKGTVLKQLQKAGELDLSAYFPLSALTGEGVEAFVEHLLARLPEGPAYYSDDT